LNLRAKIGKVKQSSRQILKNSEENRPIVGLFLANPTHGNFTMSPAGSMPAGTGVDPAMLTVLAKPTLFRDEGILGTGIK
jgi:hypothetical protein